MSKQRTFPTSLAACALILLLAVLAVYANHFQNGFHFDDWHTITQNPSIRDLGNLPRFFTDSRTMSVLPANQTYRPVVTASLALDYRLGRGLNPVAFHASTFFWFVVQLAAMFWLYRKLLQPAWPAQQAAWLALFATAWYGLHPVSAETVNYVVQRADLYVALGVVAGLALYAGFPGLRTWGLYLLPVVLAGLSKPTALIFPALLILYLVLAERVSMQVAMRRALPSITTVAALGWLVQAMTPKNFSSASSPFWEYVITQPFVALHYALSFFLPLWLTADSDRQLLTSFWSDEALLGFAFVVTLTGTAWWASRYTRFQPVAFGLFWFLLTLVPTAVMPLAEVENDHRMFLPFVGLALAATAGGRLIYEWATRRFAAVHALRPVCTLASVALLAAYGMGAHERNKVWRTDESLWFDVTQKSPRNGRGLMNYGLSQMAKGEYRRAIDYYERALRFTPNYHYLHINLGIAHGALGRDAQAEASFQRALQLAPTDALPPFHYGQWLKTRGRAAEAVQQLQAAIQRNPVQADARAALMQTYAEAGDWSQLQALAADTLAVFPGDPQATTFLQQARAGQTQPVIAANPGPTPETYLNLSLAYHRAGRYADCIEAARNALRLRPDYAEAYNNIAAGYQSLGQWDEAIQAAEAALRLRPTLQLARNNLAYSQAQKRLAAGKRGRLT